MKSMLICCLMCVFAVTIATAQPPTDADVGKQLQKYYRQGDQPLWAGALQDLTAEKPE